MKRIGTLMACGALTLAFTACDDGRTTSDPDGGPLMLMDGSGGGDEDSGMTTTDPDSGTTPDPDAGMDDGCPAAMAPTPPMPMACAAATFSCLMTATTQPAQQACIDDDPNAMNCSACINADIAYRCTNVPTGGCAEQYGELQCCIAEQCPGGVTQACAAMAVGTAAAPGPCATDANTFIMCLNAAQMAMQCGLTSTCFQSGA